MHNQIWCWRRGKQFVNKEFPVSDTQKPVEQSKANKWLMVTMQTLEQKIWEWTHPLDWPNSSVGMKGECHRVPVPPSAAWLTVFGMLGEGPEWQPKSVSPSFPKAALNLEGYTGIMGMRPPSIHFVPHMDEMINTAHNYLVVFYWRLA